MNSRRGLCGDHESHKFPRYHLLLSGFYSPKIAGELIDCSPKNTPSSDYKVTEGVRVYVLQDAHSPYGAILVRD